jgi:aminomethyltransferase
MNQMQPVVRRAPRASVVLDRSVRALPSGTERYVVPGAGSVVVPVSAGDTVTVRDVEGCQPCELLFAGADGRVDPRGLGVPAGARPDGLLALLADGGESARQTRAALARRAIDLVGSRALRVFGGDSPAGSTARFTVERDGLLIVAAPGGVMDAERQNTATEIELLIARRLPPTAGQDVRLPSRWPIRSTISASRQQPQPPIASRPAITSRSSMWQAGNAPTSSASRPQA